MTGISLSSGMGREWKGVTLGGWEGSPKIRR